MVIVIIIQLDIYVRLCERHLFYRFWLCKIHPSHLLHYLEKIQTIHKLRTKEHNVTNHTFSSLEFNSPLSSY